MCVLHEFCFDVLHSSLFVSSFNYTQHKRLLRVSVANVPVFLPKNNSGCEEDTEAEGRNIFWILGNEAILFSSDNLCTSDFLHTLLFTFLYFEWRCWGKGILGVQITLQTFLLTCGGRKIAAIVFIRGSNNTKHQHAFAK